MTRLLPAALLLGGFCFSAAGKDFYVGVDPEVPTIAHAIKQAGPGDTIHLEAGKIYRDYAGFYGKKGEKDRPIVFDGHGATLEGSDPLDPAQWREVSPGLFAADELLPNLSDAVVGRWFFLFDGRMERMGRTSKGRSAPWKDPEKLRPGEWTFVKDSLRDNSESKQIHGTFFLKLAPGAALEDAKIAVPVRSAGVQFSGDNAHLVIRNLTATHPYNDGFNIHGDCRDVLFKNIRAIECGDDGISAHESAQYHVEGLVSIGNSTGICDTGTARTSYRKVFIADCLGFDLYFLDEGRYAVIDALVLSSAQNPFSVSGRAGGDCRLMLGNVHLKRLVEPCLGTIAEHAMVTGKSCTFEGLDLKIGGTAAWVDSILNGQPSETGATGAAVDELLKLAPKFPSTSHP